MADNDTAQPGTAIVPLTPGPLAGLQAPPRLVIERAKEVAEVLAEVIEQKHLYAEIKRTNRRTGETDTRKHVTIEGWTTTGMLCGPLLGDAVMPYVVWSHPMAGRNGGIWGYETRVEARTSSGLTLVAAEAACTRGEDRWANAPDFQIKSMSQTRASAKALRLALGWIVALAGFDSTPAEEIDADDDKKAARSGSTAAQKPVEPPIINGGGDTWAAKLRTFQKERGLELPAILELLDIPERALMEPEKAFMTYVGTLRAQRDWTSEQAYQFIYLNLKGDTNGTDQPATTEEPVSAANEEAAPPAKTRQHTK